MVALTQMVVAGAEAPRPGLLLPAAQWSGSGRSTRMRVQMVALTEMVVAGVEAPRPGLLRPAAQWWGSGWSTWRRLLPACVMEVVLEYGDVHLLCRPRYRT